jgi:soluble lytic murein transglycosylase-like protein
LLVRYSWPIVFILTGCFPRIISYDEPGKVPVQKANGDRRSFKLDLDEQTLIRFIRRRNPFIPQTLIELEAGLILSEAKNNQIPPVLLAGLIATESSFNPNAVSPVGAQGLGQLMPPTARDLGVENAFDPGQNIRGTSKYIAWLYKNSEYNWDYTFGSYLAGIGTVKKRLKNGQALSVEMQQYANKIISLARSLEQESN